VTLVDLLQSHDMAATTAAAAVHAHVGIYERVVELISNSPSARTDADILPVLSWFRTRNELFHSLAQGEFNF